MRRRRRRPATAEKHASPNLTSRGDARARARDEMMRGAITRAYRADRARVVELLNEALATEIVCVLRYKRHALAASGIHARSLARELRDHASAEQRHADRIAERIVQLEGSPDLSPNGLAERSVTEYVEGDSLVDMMREDLVAERIVVEHYTDLIRMVGDDDPTTRRLFEDILADEEEHAHELASYLETADEGAMGRAD